MARMLRITLLLWLTVWFAGIVPSHQVGAIKLPGSAVRSQYSGMGAGLSLKAGGHCCPQPEDDQPRTPSRGSCAVCQLVAKLDIARPIILTAPELGLAEVLPVPAPERPTFLHDLPIHSGRDPPSSVA